MHNAKILWWPILWNSIFWRMSWGEWTYVREKKKEKMHNWDFYGQHENITESYWMQHSDRILIKGRELREKNIYSGLKHYKNYPTKYNILTYVLEENQLVKERRGENGYLWAVDRLQENITIAILPNSTFWHMSLKRIKLWKRGDEKMCICDMKKLHENITIAILLNATFWHMSSKRINLWKREDEKMLICDMKRLYENITIAILPNAPFWHVRHLERECVREKKIMFFVTRMCNKKISQKISAKLALFWQVPDEDKRTLQIFHTSRAPRSINSHSHTCTSLSQKEKHSKVLSISFLNRSCPTLKHKDAKIFEKHLNPVMLVFIR